MHPEKNVLNVLVVVDMQKDFVDGSLGTPEAQAIVPRVVAKIQAYRQAGGVILVTQDTHGPDYMDTQEGRCLPVLHCVKDTGGWRLDAPGGRGPAGGRRVPGKAHFRLHGLDLPGGRICGKVRAGECPDRAYRPLHGHLRGVQCPMPESLLPGAAPGPWTPPAAPA